jgi:general secretion pathway protein G
MMLGTLAIAIGGVVAGVCPAADATTQTSAAQERAIRAIQCLANLKQISLAISLYSFDHDGKYPPDLGTLLVAEKLNLPVFICPSAGSSLPPHWQTMAPKEQADWVNAHTDYVYLGKKSGLGRDNGGEPLVYDRDDDHDGAGMNVLFTDLSVQFLSLDAVHQRIGPKAGAERTTTRIERAAGQPPAIPLITLDEARAILAQDAISTLTTALKSFELDNGRYPTTKEGLDALIKKPADDLPDWHQHLTELPDDPWGHPYVYRCPGEDNADFSIFSSGPDGKPGTSDDVK